MFLDLIKLYKKNNNKTPLEDFNTECFVNILRLYEEIKLDFIHNFLGLPSDDTYRIETQLKRGLPKDSDCIIDMVFQGDKNICFIENKVESKEGHNQLERYGKVLDRHFSEYEKHLFYCTKYSDPKNQKGEYKKYKFKQFKWYEVAKVLKKYKDENPLVKEYLKFLNQYKMAQDNTFKTENFLVMENMKKTLEIIEFHIEQPKEKFIELFGENRKDLKKGKWGQLKNNRLCYWYENIFKSGGGWSEIIYSIELSTLRLSTGIYVELKHEQYNKFLEADKSGLEREIHEKGTSFYLTEDLEKYLNDEESDKKIKKWFEDSFKKLKEFVDKNPQLDWEI